MAQDRLAEYEMPCPAPDRVRDARYVTASAEERAMTTSAVHHETDLFSAATHRCDMCLAPAQVRVELIGGDLRFCTHHYRKHRAVVRQAAMSGSVVLP
jgi:hypothetical protein